MGVAVDRPLHRQRFALQGLHPLIVPPRVEHQRQIAEIGGHLGMRLLVEERAPHFQRLSQVLFR